VTIKLTQTTYLLIMLIIETHATSHVGRIRQGNEDNFLMLDIADSKTWVSSQDPGEFIIESQTFNVDLDGIVLAVSDGMGGALAGEVASKMAVESVSQKFLEADMDETISPHKFNDSLVAKLYDATVQANFLIHHQGRTDPQFQGMGATFTAVGITPNEVNLVQVGDSRVYLIRGEQIYQVTKDQSLVQQLIDAQQILPEEAETHSLKNVILQALGAQPEIYPVAARLIPQENDILLLCSDGLSNEISGTDMQRIILENVNQLEVASAELVKAANENGGKDNITVILAKITGDELSAPTDDEIKIELLDLGSIHDTADQDTAEIL
jgi:protein phosphatase